MNDQEKLRVLLPHWIEHNEGHGKEFTKWANLLHGAGESDLADLLNRASASLKEADTVLRAALERSGGALQDHDHHHHHNLPE